jgi:hypothetical protein
MDAVHGAMKRPPGVHTEDITDHRSFPTHNPNRVERICIRDHAPARDQSIRWLEANSSRVCGRESYGTSSICSQCSRISMSEIQRLWTLKKYSRIALACSNCYSTSPRAPPCREWCLVPILPQISDWPKPRIDRVRTHPKFVQVRLSRHHSSSVLQGLNHRCIEGTGELIQHSGSACRW